MFRGQPAREQRPAINGPRVQETENGVLRHPRLRTAAVLAAGAVLGYAAASDRLSLSPNARAAHLPADQTDRAEPTNQGRKTEPASCTDDVGKGPSKRKELFYFAKGTLGAVRIGDYRYRFIGQPNGWLGGTVKPGWPTLTNIRLDPLERTGLSGSISFYNCYAYEFWRFVYMQQEVAMFGETFFEFSPKQKGASLNPEAVK
jgi:hypothetical protein